MRFSPSNNHDREFLFAVTGRVPLELARDAALTQQARHADQDDMGEWAALNAEGLRLGLADARLQKLADEESAKVLRESLSRFSQHAGCTGDCCDGVSPGDCTCGHALAWQTPRQPRVRIKRRSRWSRVLRNLVRWLLSQRAW